MAIIKFVSVKCSIFNADYADIFVNDYLALYLMLKLEFGPPMKKDGHPYFSRTLKKYTHS